MQGVTVSKRSFRRQGIKASKFGRGNPDYAVAIHDRRATDLVRGAEVAPIEVDDPLAMEPGDKLTVMRSTRDDPLAKLHSRKQIDEAQYRGGRAFQQDFEKAERGPRAIDPSKEAVDGGTTPEPITEGQRRAVLRLNRALQELGADGGAIATEVLIHRKTTSQVAASRHLSGEQWEKYFGKRFRECLDRLALIYGFASHVDIRNAGS